MNVKNIAMICKLMPYYRLGIFKKLTLRDGDYQFSFFGDTTAQGGIKQIPYSHASAPKGERIRWIKTKNYFYKPERLLWQTGIIKEIFKSKFKVFVFEGAIAHYPIWWYAFLCKLFGKKVLFWTHGNRGLDKGIKKFLRVILFKWLGDGLLLYGNTQRDLMISDGYSPKKLTVVYNSLQPEKQFELLSNLNIDLVDKKKQSIFDQPEHFTFIFIGRLVGEKGLIEILNAIATLKQQGLLINSIFIGKGPEKDKMIQFSKEHHIEKEVHFTGAIYKEEELAPYFAMSNLMVSPGNVGLNCIHAFAYGIPVITHNDFKYHGPEVEAISEGKTGSFYERNNFEDMALKIKQWIEAKHDKTMIKRNCQNVIKQTYNPEYQAKCITNALNMLFKNV